MKIDLVVHAVSVAAYPNTDHDMQVVLDGVDFDHLARDLKEQCMKALLEEFGVNRVREWLEAQDG